MKRAVIVIAALFAGAALVSCASVEPEPAPGNGGGDVEALAQRLVLAAQERTDLRPVRVWVTSVEPVGASAQAPNATASAAVDPLAERLEHELVLALAGRLNVVDSDVAREESASVGGATLQERAAARGATHVLLGDYERRRDSLTTTVRLVDAESRLIVAAVRGDVRLGKGGLEGVDAGGKPPPRAPARAGAVAPAATTTSATTSAPASVPPAPRADLDASTTPHAAPESAPAAQPSAAPAAAPTTLAPVQPESAARGWPVEDFETWYQRRQAEKAAAEPSGTSPAPASAGARPQELSAQPADSAAEFPWRSNTGLARLLGVPQTTTRPR